MIPIVVQGFMRFITIISLKLQPENKVKTVKVIPLDSGGGGGGGGGGGDILVGQLLIQVSNYHTQHSRDKRYRILRGSTIHIEHEDVQVKPTNSTLSC